MIATIRSVALLGAFVLVATACGAGTVDPSSPGDSQGAPAEETATTPTGTMPTIEFELVGSAAVTSEIGPDGGELVTGHGDVEYRLVIPPGALADPTEITLTPVDGATSGFVDLTMGGAQFSPSGLVLASPAVLELSGPTVPADLMAVRWEESGGPVVPTLGVRADSAGVRIPIVHFSGAGAGSPGPDPSGDVPPMGTDRATAALRDAVQAWQPGDPCIAADSPAGVTSLAYYTTAGRDDLVPALKAAQGDDLLLASTMRPLVEWWALPVVVEGLLGAIACDDLIDAFQSVRDGFAEEIDIRLESAMVHALYESGRQCRARKDVGEVRTMVAWMEKAHGLALAGILESTGSVEAATRTVGAACATFRVEVRSQLTLDAADAGRFRGTIAAVAENVPEAFLDELIVRTGEFSFDFGEPSYHLELPPSSDSCTLENRSELSPIRGIYLTLRYPEPTRRIPGLDQGGGDTGSDGEGGDSVLALDPLEATGAIVAKCDDMTMQIPKMGQLVPMWFNGAHKTSDPMGNWVEFPLELTGGTNPFASFTSTEPIVDPTDPSARVEQETEVKVFPTPQDPGQEPPPPPDDL